MLKKTFRFHLAASLALLSCCGCVREEPFIYRYRFGERELIVNRVSRFPDADFLAAFVKDGRGPLGSTSYIGYYKLSYEFNAAQKNGLVYLTEKENPSKILFLFDEAGKVLWPTAADHPKDAEQSKQLADETVSTRLGKAFKVGRLRE